MFFLGIILTQLISKQFLYWRIVVQNLMVLFLIVHKLTEDWAKLGIIGSINN